MVLRSLRDLAMVALFEDKRGSFWGTKGTLIIRILRTGTASRLKDKHKNIFKDWLETNLRGLVEHIASREGLR